MAVQEHINVFKKKKIQNPFHSDPTLLIDLNIWPTTADFPVIFIDHASLTQSASICY